TVRERDLWIADRNFCTTKFLFGIAARLGRFVIRQHASTLRWQRVGPQRPAGRCETGRLFQQTLWLQDETGRTLRVRRVTITLDQPTSDGETTIHLLTNLTVRQAAAATVAQLYRARWGIEGVLQTLTTVLQCDVNTLGYPK